MNIFLIFKKPWGSLSVNAAVGLQPRLGFSSILLLRYRLHSLMRRILEVSSGTRLSTSQLLLAQKPEPLPWRDVSQRDRFLGWFWQAPTIAQSLKENGRGLDTHGTWECDCPSHRSRLPYPPSCRPIAQRKPVLLDTKLLWRFLSCCFLLFIQWSVGCFQINPLNTKFWECMTLKMRTDNSLLVGFIIKHVVTA